MEVSLTMLDLYEIARLHGLTPVNHAVPKGNRTRPRLREQACTDVCIRDVPESEWADLTQHATEELYAHVGKMIVTHRYVSWEGYNKILFTTYVKKEYRGVFRISCVTKLYCDEKGG